MNMTIAAFALMLSVIYIKQLPFKHYFPNPPIISKI